MAMNLLVSFVSLVCAAVFAPANAPQLVMSQQLDLRILLQGEMPRVYADDIQIVFAPPGEFRFKAVYKNGDEAIAEKQFRSLTRGGPFALARIDRAGFVELGSNDGPRRVEYYVDDTLIGSLDFTLIKHTSDDPFNPQVSWSIEGPWSQHAYLVVDGDRGENARLSLVYWVGSHEVPLDGEIVVVVRKDGQQVGTLDKRRISNPGNNRFEHNIRMADNNFLTMGGLAQLEGGFVMDVEHNGAILRSFPFAVSGGVLVPHERSHPAALGEMPLLSPRFIGEASQNEASLSPKVLTWSTAR